MHVEEGALVGGVVGSVSILPTTAVGGIPFKAMVISIIDADETPSLTYQNYKFIQTEDLTKIGVAIHPYGGIVLNAEVTSPLMTGEELIVVEFDGKQYGAELMELLEALPSTPITFELIEDEGGLGE